MGNKALFLMAMAACAGCAGCATKPPVHDVELGLPVAVQDSCVPLRAHVLGAVVDQQVVKIEDPKAAGVTVPSDATSLFITCVETGRRPQGCEGAGNFSILNPQQFTVDLSKAPHYTLECRVVGWSTPEPLIKVLVTEPYKGELTPVNPTAF